MPVLNSRKCNFSHICSWRDAYFRKSGTHTFPESGNWAFIISLSDAVPSRYIISASSIIWAADIPYVFEKFAKVQLFALLYRGDTSFRSFFVHKLLSQEMLIIDVCVHCTGWNEFKSEVSLPSFQEWSKFKLHWASQILITSLSKLIHSASHFSADWLCHIVVQTEDTGKTKVLNESWKYVINR